MSHPLRMVDDMLLPTICPACQRPGPSPCAACVATMRRSGPLLVPAGLAACRALLAYDGAGREVVLRLKYRNARSALAWLTAGMAALVHPGDSAAVVTWAPTTRQRRRERGFDQAELLARHLAARLGLSCRPLLARRPGPAQTGRSHVERRAGPKFQVRASAVRRVEPGALLIVDDVITTGATMSAAGTVLREAGLGRLIGIVAAHTAAPVSSAPAA